VTDVPSGVTLPLEIKKIITVAGMIQVTITPFQTLVTSYYLLSFYLIWPYITSVLLSVTSLHDL
jgi:hypothetical protein